MTGSGRPEQPRGTVRRNPACRPRSALHWLARAFCEVEKDCVESLNRISIHRTQPAAGRRCGHLRGGQWRRRRRAMTGKTGYSSAQVQPSRTPKPQFSAVRSSRTRDREPTQAVPNSFSRSATLTHTMSTPRRRRSIRASAATRYVE